METSATKIYGPVYQMILGMQNVSDAELLKMMPKLFELNQQTYSAFESFDEEYNRIRQATIDLEEKLKSLDALIDKRMSETSPGDLALSRTSCEEIYKGYWDKLDEFSKTYLTMANYLYKLFIQDDTDCSPAVLEFGRAMENELVQKIYSGYVESLSGHTNGMIDSGSLYGELKSAIREFTNKGEYYIPARAMVKYLGYLSDEDIINAYNEALKEYLQGNGVNKDVVSESGFVTDTDELFDKYRNTAAHPGSTMDSDTAKRCRERTKKVLKRFMSAMPSVEIAE